MNNVCKIVIILCLMPGYALSIFERDRAARLAQQGAWKEASAMIQPLLVNNEQDPSLFFDAGVMAYKAGEFAQAAAYWKSVINDEHASDSLKEQAYFNLGNVSVQLNKLEDAVHYYESAIALNSEHEQVRHNLEKIKEVLEQQKEEKQKVQQQSNNGQSPDNDQQLQQPKSSPGNNQKTEFGEYQQEDDQGNVQTDGDQEQGNESQNENQSHESKQNQKNGQSAQGDQQLQDKQTGSSGEQKGNNQHEQRENEHSKTDTLFGQENEKEDNLQQAKPGNTQQLAQQNALKGGSIQEQMQDEQEQEPVPADPKEAYIAKILDSQEKADEKAAKMLMKRCMNRNVAGKHGVRNW